jgi:hypothetical protein
MTVRLELGRKFPPSICQSGIVTGQQVVSLLLQHADNSSADSAADVASQLLYDCRFREWLRHLNPTLTAKDIPTLPESGLYHLCRATTMTNGPQLTTQTLKVLGTLLNNRPDCSVGGRHWTRNETPIRDSLSHSSSPGRVRMGGKLLGIRNTTGAWQAQTSVLSAHRNRSTHRQGGYTRFHLHDWRAGMAQALVATLARFIFAAPDVKRH